MASKDDKVEWARSNPAVFKSVVWTYQWFGLLLRRIEIKFSALFVERK